MNLMLIRLFSMFFLSVQGSKAVNAPTSVNQAAAITTISYDKTGGRGGNTEHLEISKNSITYTQGKAGIEKNIHEKITASTWNKLAKSLNLRQFDKVKSSPGHAMYDGIDITITVTSGKTQHSIVNGNEDSENYKNLKVFTDLLDAQLERLRKKIIW